VGTSLFLRAQFCIKIESTARFGFSVDGHRPSIFDRDRGFNFEI
jgi:hypothetical protein